MSVITDLKTLIREAGKAKRKVADERARISNRLIELQAERKALLSAPLSRQDLEACLRDDITAAGREAMGWDVPRLLEDARQHAGGRVEYPVDHAVYSPIPSKIDGHLVCLLLGPEAIISALAPALDKLDFTGAGLPLEQRRARLAEITAEISELVAQRQELAEALDEPEPKYKAKPGTPQLGDTQEKIGGDGKVYVGTFCNPTGHGSPGWLWKEKAA